MITAEEIKPGDILLMKGAVPESANEYDVVYTVENVRVDRGVRLTYTADNGERVEEKGSVSCLVRFADGGSDVRRFSLGQETPLTPRAEVVFP